MAFSIATNISEIDNANGTDVDLLAGGPQGSAIFGRVQASTGKLLLFVVGSANANWNGFQLGADGRVQTVNA